MPQSLGIFDRIAPTPEALTKPAGPAGPSVADRHNNPLNIKYGPATQKWLDSGDAELGESSTDGGRFLKFKSPELGFQAAKELLTSPNYRDMDVHSALQKWSNKGYGAEITGVDPTKRVGELGDEEQQNVVDSMAKTEGYTGTSGPVGRGDLGIFDRLSRGASGSWDAPTISDKYDQFMEKHPYIRSAAEFIPRIGKGAVDAAVGTAELAKEAGEAYIGGAGPRIEFAKKFGKQLVQPLQEHQAGMMEAAQKGKVYIPPAFRSPEAVGETIGQLGFGSTLGSAIGELESTGIPTSAAQRSEIQSLAQISRSGIKSGAPQEAAAAVQPLLKQAVKEAEFQPAAIATKEAAKQSDVFGDLYRGGTEGQAKVMAKKLGQRYDPAAPKPIPIMLADHMVDIAHRPVESVIKTFKDTAVPEIQSAIVSDMRSLASSTEAVDPALARAYSNLADSVEAADGTVGAINDFKVHANKETGRLFKLTPSGEVAASATPVWAYRTLADLVRKHLYPELTALQGPEGLNLSQFGRREAHAINVRDGIYSEWAKAAGDQAPAELQGYLDYVLEGHSPTVHLALSPKSAASVGAMSRAIKGRPFPLADFNRLFQRGIGTVEGYVPPAPYRKGFMPTKFNLIGQQQDLLPAGAVDTEPLLAPPAGTANTRTGPYDPNKGGRTGSTLGEDIFRVQQRADREARIRKPENLTGTQIPIAENATPQSTGKPGASGEFFPGRRGIVINTEKGGQPVINSSGVHVTNKEGKPLYRHDYTNQSQLFSLSQDVPRWHPSMKEVASTQELQTVLNEIEQHLAQNPNSPMRAELKADTVKLRQELERRRAAQRVPKSDMEF